MIACPWIAVVGALIGIAFLIRTERKRSHKHDSVMSELQRTVRENHEAEMALLRRAAEAMRRCRRYHSPKEMN